VIGFIALARIRVGVVVGLIAALAVGLGADQLHKSSGGPTFNGLIDICCTSNGVGAANFGSTGQQDSGYGVEATGGTGYAPAQMDSQWAQSFTTSVTWLTQTGNLRGYDIAGNLNIGAEQSLGRAIVQLGLHASPTITKLALSGSVLNTHWIPSATTPLNSGVNLFNQYVAYLQAKELALGKSHDAIVLFIGENDTSNSTNANAFQANLGTFISGLRTALGRPTQLFYVVVINSATTGSFTSTVRTGAINYVASDPYARAIYVDDIVMASNPHYGANGYYTIGDRIARQLNRDFFSDTPRYRFVAPTTTPQLVDRGSAVTIAAAGSGTPRAGAEERDGDYELLVVTGQSAAATYTLTTAAGFTQIGTTFESVFGGTNHRTMAVYERVVSTAAMTNNGYMLLPTISATGVQSSIAEILTFRGPNKWTVSPLSSSATGANNANTTGLTIAGGTTTANNALAIVINSIPATSTAGPLATSCTNASVTFTKRYESVGNQASFIGATVWTGPVPTSGTVVGTSTLVMGGTGVNVGWQGFINP